MGEQEPSTNLFAEDFSAFMHEFVDESDRAAVILGAAKIEHLLEELLDKYFLPSVNSSDELIEGDSPLSTFSAKIKICYRLGIIDDRFAKLLNTFRRLRNGFAHDVTHNTLSTGAARDRVLALADPFNDTQLFQGLVKMVAKQSGRDLKDPGVVFRAVLAVFLVELIKIHNAIVPAERHFKDGIVESTASSNPPQQEEQSEDCGE